MFRVLFLPLHTNMVNSFNVILLLKKIITIFFWMSIAGGFIILMDVWLNIPDEISGVLYFLSIGIAISSVLNHYR